MNLETIDGQKVVEEFIVLHHEWECDGYGWVTEDGRIWHTSHGSEPYEVDEDECLELMEAPLESVAGLQRAMRTALKRKRERSKNVR